MKFITKTDIQQRITAHILSQITTDNDSLLDNAEKQAIVQIADLLSGLYDTNSEFEKTEPSRHQLLKMWTVSLVCYYIYAHIPDAEVPERIVKDYNDTLSMLNKIALGKIPTTLMPITDSTGQTARIFRYGFNAKRSHQIL